MDKYELINSLFHKRNKAGFKYNKFVELSINELKDDSNNLSSLLKRVKNIETNINIEHSEENIIDNNEVNTKTNIEVEDTEENNISTHEKLRKTYFNPNYNTKFLEAFNQDPVLKTTCHLVDSDMLNDLRNRFDDGNYSIKNHKKLIEERYNKLEKYHKSASYKLKAMIRVFLTGKNFKGDTNQKWSADQIKINWFSVELNNWALKNVGLPPNPDEDLKASSGNTGFKLGRNFSFDSFITKNTIKNFSELTLYFKSLFHIRKPNPLDKYLSNVNKEKMFADFQFEFENFNSEIVLFTQVDKIVNSYRILLKLIKEISDLSEGENSPKVKISFFRNNDQTTLLTVNHINTIYNTDIQSATNGRIGTKYNGLIKDINGVCDFYVKAKFSDNKIYSINLWDNKTLGYQEIDDPDFNGVQYIYKF